MDITAKEQLGTYASDISSLFAKIYIIQSHLSLERTSGHTIHSIHTNSRIQELYLTFQIVVLFL